MNYDKQTYKNEKNETHHRAPSTTCAYNLFHVTLENPFYTKYNTVTDEVFTVTE